MDGKILLRQAIYHQGSPRMLTIRTYGKEDFPQLIDIQRECFPPPFPSELWWNEEQLTNHVDFFPQGALCAEMDGMLVGSMTGLLVNYQPGNVHKWAEMTDHGYIKNAHDPQGNCLYIVDISVRPSYRSLGIGRYLMQAMYYLVVYLNLDRLLGGGRMPGYQHYAQTMTAEDYIAAVVADKIKDPVITFLLRCGRSVVKVVPDYLDDEESGNYGVLMEWVNPFKAR